MLKQQQKDVLSGFRLSSLSRKAVEAPEEWFRGVGSKIKKTGLEYEEWQVCRVQWHMKNLQGGFTSFTWCSPTAHGTQGRAAVTAPTTEIIFRTGGNNQRPVHSLRGRGSKSSDRAQVPSGAFLSKDS